MNMKYPDFVLQIYILTTGAFNLQPLFQKSVEKWFQKSDSANSDFFFLVNHFSRTRKNVDLQYKTAFFSGQPLFLNHFSQTRFLKLLFSNLKKMWIVSINPSLFWSTTFLEPEKNPSLKNHFSQTRFLEPLFYTFLEKWLQIKWSIT